MIRIGMIGTGLIAREHALAISMIHGSASLVAAADVVNEKLQTFCSWIGEVQSALIERHSYIPHTSHGENGWWGLWKVAGGGVLMTQLIHELDLLLLAMGRPLSVSAAMDTCYTGIESEDYVEATIRFA